MLKLSRKNAEEEPEDLGTGFGTWLADMLPFMPSGARRTGAAKVMAERVGIDPSFNVDNPYGSQLMALGAGGLLSGALLRGSPPAVGIAAALAPLIIVNALRRREMQNIQETYDTEKRKRLRDIDVSELVFQPRLGFTDGSQRLGAASAYESMRKRKYQGFGSIAEAGDALRIASGVNPLAYVAGIPLTSMIDSAAAGRLLKRADFADQKNSPTLPLYLAAGLLSNIGAFGANEWFRSAASDTPNLPIAERVALSKEMTRGNPLSYVGNMSGNAGYIAGSPDPRKNRAILNDLEYGYGFDDAEGSISRSDPKSLASKLQRLAQFGAIATDRAQAGVPIVAHEAGHALVEQTPGFARFLQRHVYPHSRMLSTLAGVGSMAAGLSAGSTLKGALIGTGIGALGGLGHIVPETMASYNALKFLKGYQGGKHHGEAKQDLLAALSTYLAGNVLPSTLAGAAGGWIGGRRKAKREEEEAEAVNNPQRII